MNHRLNEQLHQAWLKNNELYLAAMNTELGSPEAEAAWIASGEADKLFEDLYTQASNEGER